MSCLVLSIILLLFVIWLSDGVDVVVGVVLLGVRCWVFG